MLTRVHLVGSIESKSDLSSFSVSLEDILIASVHIYTTACTVQPTDLVRRLSAIAAQLCYAYIAISS